MLEVRRLCLEEFSARVAPFLAAREVEHNLILGILAQHAARQTPQSDAVWLALEDDGVVVAAAVRTHFDMGFRTGVVIGNPIAAADELPLEVYHRALTAALAAATAQGVQGRDVTPFLLEHMRQLTAGKSVTVNQSLLVNNALLAADLAVELARQR